MKKIWTMCAFALFTLAANAQAPVSKKEAKKDKAAPVQTAPAAEPTTAAPEAPATTSEAAPKAVHKMNKKVKKKGRKV
jgi:hypothetical protein